MNFSSALLENAVHEFSKLPGIGKKTALRLVLHLLKQDEKQVTLFSETIARMRKEIKFCRTCHHISDADTCSICNNPKRNTKLICVVENIRDVIAIEHTEQYNGLYHVLNGVISPLDGISPDQLNIDSLISRVTETQAEELVFALSPNIQGDTTIYYIRKLLKDNTVKTTTISRGISFGGELEYADEMTLARSISNRIPVENYISSL
jgi:recombination protein RecR